MIKRTQKTAVIMLLVTLGLGSLSGCNAEKTAAVARLAKGETASGDAVVSISAPKQVTGLTTETLSSKQVKLSWHKEAADGYFVYRKDGKKAYKLINKTTKTTLKLKAIPNVKTRFKVVAFNKENGQTAKAKAATARYFLNRISLSAAGDCTLGVDSRYNNCFNDMYARQTPDYFLKKVKPFFEKDDVTIVNFEGTLTEANTRAEKTFTFKGKKEYTKILTSSSVEVVNLANNHTMDFLERGMNDTKKALKDAKVKYCILDTIAYKKVRGTKIAFLGFSGLSGVSNERVGQNIDKAKKNGAKVIVVSFHWGIEREYYPNAGQKDYAHYAIDKGANLVIGHHPHVLQGIEKYKKSYILYSLGNFCFGGNANPSDKDTMVYTQNFYVDSHGKFVKNKDAQAHVCSLSGHRNTNDFQPTPVSGSEKTRIIGKLRTMSRNMHVTIGDNGEVK